MDTPPKSVGSEEKLLSPTERNQKIKDTLGQIMTSLGSIKYLNTAGAEIAERVTYLKAKYPDDIYDRSIFHALTLSSIGDSEFEVIDDDFPGGDSVVEFVDYLDKRYGKKSEVPPTE